jgi:hypothetical protein
MSLFGDGIESLAPVVGGSVQHGHLHGTWDGYPLEAWTSRGDPRPQMQYTARGIGASVNMLTLMLRGVPGHTMWKCERKPAGLIPSAKPEVCFVEVLTSAIDRRLEALTGMPMPDPEVQLRLEAAGLLTLLARLVQGGGWLPIVAFTPSSAGAVEHVMSQIPGFAGLDEAALERMRASSSLTLTVEVAKGKVPSPERFQDHLDVAAQVVRINKTVNPSLDPAPVAPPSPADPAVTAAPLAQAVVGSWAGPLMFMDFRADGSMIAGRGDKHREGRWSVDADGRLLAGAVNDDHNQAWVEGEELTIVMRGMAMKFQRTAADRN